LITEEQALEVLGEYLAAFLAEEQDWSVTDTLMHTRKKEEALEAYDTALRAVHRVLEKKGFSILRNLAETTTLSNVIQNHIETTEDGISYVLREFFSKMLDVSSNIVRKALEERTRETALKLAERALSKYPKYTSR